MKRVDSTELTYAAKALRAGRLVVFPTETVYGLGADATNPDAVRSIFRAKGRPSDNPLIVHLWSLNQLPVVASDTSELALTLFNAFTPGPLTVVLPVSDAVAPEVSAGLGTVAVRFPAHPVALRLLQEADVPVAAPSANRSGEPSPTTMEMSRRTLGDAVTAYLDGGPCTIGIESTVVAVEQEHIRILRPGALSAEQLGEVSGVEVTSATDEDDRRASPGTRHRHYQPRARVVLFGVKSPVDTDVDDVSRQIRAYPGSGPVGLIRMKNVREVHPGTPTGGTAAGYPSPGGRLAVVREYGSLHEYARNLYRWLVEFDEAECEVIFAHLPEKSGIGTALRDRLTRAAG